ncbi:uncharacterized protein CANTADRAFT_26798 [Suhomyces tanzawaensis NRRL Y-17324]|uniref:Uncharacterized protein n=1 Tax=Suhomyces tanzawaensis NRRL Y-17324 TaxID=984487 RepID=A0A1E4SDX1_9ASCO|nr:uncharacterized protein CANTADRAFT_26798 [Suhomyces tanzawaensis NRRL Y-17324]ODV77714.1 hypothetical protein CANTADRAFT_26798 [Suhomyces tanzawaensis NRRL Y-17324]
MSCYGSSVTTSAMLLPAQLRPLALPEIWRRGLRNRALSNGTPESPTNPARTGEIKEVWEITIDYTTIMGAGRCTHTGV